MADYKKYQSDGVSAEDKALDKFAELMIEKIESLKNSDSWNNHGLLKVHFAGHATFPDANTTA